MSDVILPNVMETFPIGTVVGIYRDALFDSGNPTPVGDRIGEAVVAEDGSLNLGELAQDGSTYVLAAQQGEAWIVSRYATPKPNPNIGPPGKEGGAGPMGEKGEKGDTGATGPEGRASGLHYLYEINTEETVSGAQHLKLNKKPALIEEATTITINNTDADGAPNVAFLLSFDDSTNSTKGFLSLRKVGNPAVVAIFRITGAGTVVGTAVRYPVECLVKTGTFAAEDLLNVDFSRAGDKGESPFFLVDGFKTPQDAINAANTAGGGTVIFGSKTYVLTKSLVVFSNVTLTGTGTVLTAANQSFTLIRNFRATVKAGEGDVNIGICNLILDGQSVSAATDARRGCGIELYGVDGFVIDSIVCRNIPLSAIEVSGDQAAIENGVRTGAEPLPTTHGAISNVIVKGAGWQSKFLTEGEETELWGDAGYGVVIRAGAREVDVRGLISSDTRFGGFCVGQLSNVNSGEASPNKAQAHRIHASHVHVDQATARDTPAAPSIRFAFAFQCSITNWTARNNAGSQGLVIRQAGSTNNEQVAVADGFSENNTFGITVTAVSATVKTKAVSFSNVTAVKNITDGWLLECPRLALSNCFAFENGRHGFNWQSPEAGVAFAFRSSMTGCISLDNGKSTTGYGCQLKSATYVRIVGCEFSDTRAGGERTQAYGVRAIEASNKNIITANTANNNVTGQVVTVGAENVVTGNIET
jgi:hypothetical protein